MYGVGNGIWGRVFAVPADVVDKHIKLCGAVSLKVLLMLLRAESPMDTAQLAELLGQSPADIQDAVNYWVEHGIICCIDTPPQDEIPTLPEPVSITTATTAPAQIISVSIQPPAPTIRSEEQLPAGNKVITLGRRRRLSMPEVNELASGDRGLRGLISEAQSALARPLKPMETESIATIYASFELPADIILMILHYCISIGKTSVTQIEKMASDWYTRDINTHERAEQELLRISKQTEYENLIRKTLGIYGRRITEKEYTFFKRWMDELRLNSDLIRLAYEHSADAKGKLSFPDINRVLTKWHEAGVTSIDAAKKHIKNSANGAHNATSTFTSHKQKEKPAEPTPSYDLGHFEELMSSGNIWDKT